MSVEIETVRLCAKLMQKQVSAERAAWKAWMDAPAAGDGNCEELRQVWIEASKSVSHAATLYIPLMTEAFAKLEAA